MRGGCITPPALYARGLRQERRFLRINIQLYYTVREIVPDHMLCIT